MKQASVQTLHHRTNFGKYEDEGFFRPSPPSIPPAHLQILRRAGLTASIITSADAEMTAKGVKQAQRPNVKGSRYFEGFAHDRAPRLKGVFVPDTLMAHVCAAVLGGLTHISIGSNTSSRKRS